MRVTDVSPGNGATVVMIRDEVFHRSRSKSLRLDLWSKGRVLGGHGRKSDTLSVLRRLTLTFREGLDWW